jgi:hypothetical protein
MSRARSGRWFGVATAGLILALTAAPGPLSIAAADTPAAPGSARLLGPYDLAGHITVAKRVLGERAGQNFHRTWTFFPTCRTGSCATVGLVRARAGGSDRLTLHRRAPGSYSGTGRFVAPLRCARRTYARGQSVPFTVTVQVTAAVALSSGGVVATRVSATYTNSSRTNLTRCFAVLGHDAATYHGHALPAPGQA